jgi:hypothetical protein
MAHPTTPHAETQQNRKLDRTDLKPDQLEQTSAMDEDGELYRNNEGAQTGTNRAPQNFPDTASNLNTQQAVAAFEGSVSTRTPPGSGQGISSRSSDQENEGQQRVVRDRPDAQAGVNHSR